jgi:mycothiol synthase
MNAESAQRGDRLQLAEVTAVSARERAQIAALVAAATAADGVGPVDDQVRSELECGAATGSRHVLGRLGAAPGDDPDVADRIVAYSHARTAGHEVSAHLVVHPDVRRRGYGSELVQHLVDLAAAGGGTVAQERATVRIWAHGDTPGARGLAAALRFSRARELWRMRLPLAGPLPEPSYPGDVTVRPFEPGRDDAAWIALNAASFASHPEQGRLSLDDLHHRMSEPWFDPGGFFLAERDGHLVGSHWTKVHPAENSGNADGSGTSVGEVYAVGVHPDAQGLGLGKALTLTGLHYMRRRGLAEVMLYVDGDNAAAIGLYERLGFAKTSVDVMYAGSVGCTR